jgi:hypothetical protein
MIFIKKSLLATLINSRKVSLLSVFWRAQMVNMPECGCGALVAVAAIMGGKPEWNTPYQMRARPPAEIGSGGSRYVAWYWQAAASD